MKKNHKIFIASGIALLIAGFIWYKKRSKHTNIPKKPLSNKDISNRLIEMELTDKDVSGLDRGFLEAWISSAEYALTTGGGGGGMPGWEYGKTFDYKGKTYPLKGAATIKNK